MKCSLLTLPSGTNTHGIRGLSLLELLVALVILAMIVTSVYVGFNAGRNSWQVGEMVMQRYQNARGALDAMSREIPTALVNTAGTLYCIGKAGGFYFTGALKSTGVADNLYRVGYWRKPSTTNGEKPGVITRFFEGRESASPYYPFSDMGSASQPLTVHALSIAFRYYSNDNGWLAEGADWNEGILSGTADNSNQLPGAIEIKLTMEDEKATKTREFRTIINLQNENIQ